MSQSALRQPVEPPARESRKSGFRFGCLGIAIGVPILVILSGYYAMIHTAIPLRLIAKAFEADGTVSIEGIGGSISRGFTIENLRYTDESGNESFFEGLTLKWGDINRMRKHRELVIEEVGLRRAHIFVDAGDSGSDSGSDSSVDTSADTAGSGEPLNLFEIKKVDIREVLIESTDGNFKLELEEFLIEGLRIEGDDFSLAALSVGSNLVDLKVEDAESATIAGEAVPFTRRIVGALKPEIHESLAKEVDFAVELGAIGGEMVYRARALGGAVEVVSLGEGQYEALRVEEFTSTDYFSGEFAGPVTKLSLEFRSGDPNPKTGERPGLLEGGSFTLGTTPFAVGPRTVTDDTAKSGTTPPPLVATAQLGEVEITAALDEPASPPPLFRVTLSSQPERGQQDLIALLWFGKPLAELSPEEAAEVAAIEKRSFPASAE